MSKVFLGYLRREHDRLEEMIAAARRRPLPDQLELERLKKLKLVVRDQIAEFQTMVADDDVAQRDRRADRRA